MQLYVPSLYNEVVTKRKLYRKGAHRKEIRPPKFDLIDVVYDPTKKSLTSIPGDVIRLITVYLSSVDCGRLSGTCKHFKLYLKPLMSKFFHDRAKQLKRSPMELAAKYGKYEFVRELVSSGCTDRDPKIIHHFIAQRDYLTVEFLLQHDFEPSVSHIDNVVSCSQYNLIELFYNYGFICSKQGFNRACSRGDLVMVQFLYDHGSRGNDCAYKFAFVNNHSEVVKWLESHNLGM
jgi:hypothetical protein